MRGSDLLPDLVAGVGKEFRGRRIVSNKEMIAVFSKVVGRDLKDWFAKNWNLQ
jgi:hypothetical protein